MRIIILPVLPEAVIMNEDKMKKIVLLLIMLLIPLLFPTLGDASYVIHLKNGGKFMTPHYWEKDNYVTFYIVGGTMGIEKKSVRKIEKLPTDPYRDASFRAPEKPLTPAKSAPEAAEKEVNREKDSPGKPGENSEKKKLQEELRTLEAESATAAEKYYNASDQPKQGRDNVRKEIFTTSQEKRKIFQKLQENNQK